MFLTGCEDRVKPSVSDTQYGSSIPTQESWNTRIMFSQEGRTLAILYAGHVKVYEQEKRTILEDSIRVDFYDKDAHITSFLTANRGEVNDINRDLVAYENVVVISDNGTSLRTEKLLWNNSDQKIHTDAYVEIDSPKEIIQGHGMESDQDLKNYKIFKVTGQSTDIK